MKDEPLASATKVTNWRKRTKYKMVEAMGGCCQLCGYSKCAEALEFHHIDPSKKEFSLRSALANPKSIVSIINELKGCVMLCALCHREVHAGIRKPPDKPYTLDEAILTREVLNKKTVILIKKSDKVKKLTKINVSKDEICKMLASADGNKTKVAAELGVSRPTLRKYLGLSSKPTVGSKCTIDQLTDLLDEMNNNKSAVARSLGISETAVRKRLKRMTAH